MSVNGILNILLVVLVVWFFYTRFAGVKGLKTLNAEQFQSELQANRDHILIDVREPSEVKHGMIPGARNIPLSQLKGRTMDIPSGKPVYLYCRSGMRSKQAARILQRSGIGSLAHLQGGIMAWKGKLAK